MKHFAGTFRWLQTSYFWRVICRNNELYHHILWSCTFSLPAAAREVSSLLPWKLPCQWPIFDPGLCQDSSAKVKIVINVFNVGEWCKDLCSDLVLFYSNVVIDRLIEFGFSVLGTKLRTFIFVVLYLQFWGTFDDFS